jgi:hypothetical protein
LVYFCRPKEIEESKRWLEVEKHDSTYKKRDVQKRFELINWVLENMENPVQICGGYSF